MNITAIYIPLDENREIALTIETRVYNGIDTDPRVLVREPTVNEVFALVGKLTEESLCRLPIRPTLDFPEVRESGEQRAESGEKTGEMGGTR